MNRKLIISFLVIFLIMVGGTGWWYYSQKSSQALAPIEPISDNRNFQSAQSATSEPEYVFDERYRTDSMIFYCRVRPYTESGCALFVSDTSGKNLQDLDAYIDYGSFEKSILPSPSGKYLLFVQQDQDNKATLLDTSSLVQKTIFEAPTGYVLGTYTGFPSFVPYLKWIDENQIQVSIFKQYTSEPYDNEPPAIPLEVKTIRIN